MFVYKFFIVADFIRSLKTFWTYLMYFHYFVYIYYVWVLPQTNIIQNNIMHKIKNS